MNLVSKTGKTPSWFIRLINLPNLQSLLPISNTPIFYSPSLLMLQGTALDTIDERSHIKARNRYYWIAGLDSSDAMIFGRVFYTVDVHGTRIVYFSHWVTSSTDRFKISPCQGCSLHDDSIEDGPLQRDDDLILSSGTFSWTDGPVSPQSSELGFILRVLQILPRSSSVKFYSKCPYDSIFSFFQRSSAERRVRFPYYVLWMAISICLQDLQINCQFCTVPDMAADAYLSRCLTLSGLPSAVDPTPSFTTLLKDSSLQCLSINFSCTGVPLIIDPVHFWRDLSDMHEFFKLL
ncbi:hypothetical protein RhiirA4_489804, partial [Rhizophagus irregularis]